MLVNTKKLLQCQGVPYEQKERQNHQSKGFAYIETYGCQMNFADTEVVAAILAQEGYGFTQNPQEADVIFINTCSIRENAEQKIWNRLKVFRQIKQKRPHVLVGVLGCMAERLKKQLLEEEQCVDMVVGPDAYRSIPKLIEQVHFGEKAVNVLLSREETYADIAPLRLHSNGVTAFLSIMRGCNNMCTFCVVPFTRGRERSRDPDTIVREAQQLFEQGYRDITLLGQNVDSYNYKGVRFAQLLAMVAEIHPKLRVRFTTSHPKDMTDDVLYTMARYENLCKYIHLPVQSGSNRILALMRRGYTREWYLQRIERIRSILPDCAIATDIIAGFCSETEEDHQQTLDLMERVRFNSAFMFYYSERPGTYAARKLKDDVPLEVKKRRLQEIIRLQQQHSLYRNREWIGKTVEVLIEGDSKRSKEDFSGRTSQNMVVVFPKHSSYKVGDYVQVRIISATSATLKGEIVS